MANQETPAPGGALSEKLQVQIRGQVLIVTLWELANLQALIARAIDPAAMRKQFTLTQAGWSITPAPREGA